MSRVWTWPFTLQRRGMNKTEVEGTVGDDVKWLLKSRAATPECPSSSLSFSSYSYFQTSLFHQDANLSFCFLLLCLFFFRTGDQAQGFVNARQVLFCWATSQPQVPVLSVTSWTSHKHLYPTFLFLISNHSVSIQHNHQYLRFLGFFYLRSFF